MNLSTIAILAITAITPLQAMEQSSRAKRFEYPFDIGLGSHLRIIEKDIKLNGTATYEMPCEDRIPICKNIIFELTQDFSKLDHLNAKNGVLGILSQALRDIDNAVDVEKYYTVDYLEIFMGNLTTKLCWELCTDSLNLTNNPLETYKKRRNAIQDARRILGGASRIKDQRSFGSCTANLFSPGFSLATGLNPPILCEYHKIHMDYSLTPGFTWRNQNIVRTAHEQLSIRHVY